MNAAFVWGMPAWFSHPSICRYVVKEPPELLLWFLSFILFLYPLSDGSWMHARSKQALPSSWCGQCPQAIRPSTSLALFWEESPWKKIHCLSVCQRLPSVHFDEGSSELGASDHVHEEVSSWVDDHQKVGDTGHVVNHLVGLTIPAWKRNI